MNQQDYNSLLASLNTAVAILARHRSPDPKSVAAYDTLKQARAMILASLDHAASTAELPQPELAVAA